MFDGLSPAGTVSAGLAPAAATAAVFVKVAALAQSLAGNGGGLAG